MQTIKFRGKSLNTEKWVYGDLRQSGKRKFIEYEVNLRLYASLLELKTKV